MHPVNLRPVRVVIASLGAYHCLSVLTRTLLTYTRFGLPCPSRGFHLCFFLRKNPKACRFQCTYAYHCFVLVDPEPSSRVPDLRTFLQNVSAGLLTSLYFVSDVCKQTRIEILSNNINTLGYRIRSWPATTTVIMEPTPIRPNLRKSTPDQAGIVHLSP